MNYIELLRELMDIELKDDTYIGCDDIECECRYSCDNCKYNGNYLKQKVDLSKLFKFAWKSMLNQQYGNMFTYVDTDSIKKVDEGWREIPQFLYDNSLEKFSEIMDDAESNGFEFKFKGTKVYYRERPFDSNMNAPVSN